jgi:hypothetical protein
MQASDEPVLGGLPEENATLHPAVTGPSSQVPHSGVPCEPQDRSLDKELVLPVEASWTSPESLLCPGADMATYGHWRDPTMLPLSGEGGYLSFL